MSFIFEERLLESPYIESITHGRTVNSGTVIRPAETNWHMVFSKHGGTTFPIVVGPWATSGIVEFGADAEILWIKFKLGAYMPHHPTKKFLDSETILPDASSQSFWLKGSAWQFPDFENADIFVNRLVRDDVLIFDPVVNTTLCDQSPDIPARTLRHRFLHTTGLSQNHIRQIQRARQAQLMLSQGMSILDTTFEAGYYDQPHLTRSLKQFIGYTPTQIIQMSQQIQTTEIEYGQN